MQPRPSWKAASRQATQQISSILLQCSEEPATGLYPEPVVSSQYPSPHPILLGSILIFSSYLRLVLRSDLIPLHFPTKTLYALLFAPLFAAWPTHLVLLRRHYLTN
jgi:hypothetical protein